MFKNFIMDMNQPEILGYYSRPDIQTAILNFSKEREVVGSLKDGTYLNRPDILLYPKDVIERVKKGVVAFHCSVERWFNPMQLSTNLSQKEMDNLRKGFDFVIDIDAKVKLEHALIAAEVIYNFLKDLGVRTTIKFSGRRGVHIGIASEAFPDVIDFKKTSSKYPEIPQTLAEFIIEKAREQILEELINFEGGVASLVKCLPSISELSPYSFIDIERGWGNRHLFRLPYSLHPKQWLVSIPIKIEDLKQFKPEDAKPEKVKTNIEFLINKEGEAAELLLQALDWKSKQPKEIIKEVRIISKSKKLVPEELFPPCIKLILDGLKDGRKRSLFSLIAFLRNMNWSQEDVEKRIKEWNMKNSSLLPERFIKTQLKWHFRQNRNLMAANCSSTLFYDNIGICKPDGICDLKRIKNPVNYPFRLMRKKRLRSSY
jgi:hypothetical protein